MDGSAPPGGQRRPAHAGRHGLTRETERRLAALGSQLPPPSEEERKIMAHDRAVRITRRLAASLVVVLVVLLGAGAAAQWLRPVPQPALEGLTTIHIPGTSPSLPWPATGEAAMVVPGLTGLGQSRGNRPAPIAGLAGVLTAYVVVKDHPLATGGATGPSISVTPQTLAAYQDGSAAGEPEVTVAAGETLTELDALEGLLVDSGNDMATLLAVWDAGSTSAFVTKMDLTALSLGLDHTRITDPSGADPGTVSTPGDLIRLGEAAMRVPVLSQIVSLGETTLPGDRLRYNPDFDLGQDGIVGIAVSSDTATNGCYLFAAQKTLDGQTVTLYGVVLGQSGPDGPDTAAVEAGDALVKEALAAVTAYPAIPAGHVVGELAAPWGASAPVTVSEPVTVLAWPGLTVRTTARLAKLTVPLASGSRVGELVVKQGPHVTAVALSTTARLTGPSTSWRLTR